MKKNLLKIYESFFDDLDKLNKNLNKEDKENDEFGAVNGNIYDEHNYILSPDRNPEFFEGLCNMCEQYYPGLPSNENGFTQEDLNQIKDIYSNIYSNSCFKNVISLDELQYFHNLEIISPYCFYHCTKLKSVIFPKNLKKFLDSCFSHCTSLEKLNFPDSIKEIYNLSFYYCSSLKKLKFPDSIKEIYKYSFNYCTSLKEILFPKNIEIIENLTFKNCTSLEKIVIPERFKDNMKNIFYNVNLSKVDITYI